MKKSRGFLNHNLTFKFDKGSINFNFKTNGAKHDLLSVKFVML